MTDQIDTLIRDLEAAPEGSRELDERIATVVYGAPEFAVLPGGQRSNTKLFKYGNGLAGNIVPAWTTYLDAALPWENIVEVMLISLGDGEGEFLGNAWVATHEDPETGEHTNGEGQTEPLARRLAALKAQSVS